MYAAFVPQLIALTLPLLDGSHFAALNAEVFGIEVLMVEGFVFASRIISRFPL